jgi:hypothetical protein
MPHVNPELAGVKRTLALSIALDILERSNGIWREDGQQRDIGLALKLLDENFDFAAAPMPSGVPPEIALQDYVLNTMLSKLAESQHWPGDRPQSEAERDGRKLLESAREMASQGNLDLAIRDKRYAVEKLLKTVGDAELRDAGPEAVANAIHKTLDGLAGNDGKEFAATAQREREALDKFKNTIKNHREKEG